MKVRAKFYCYAITQHAGGGKQVKMNAVYSTTGENADFAKATPAGNLEITIDASTPAINAFEPGKEYYLHIEAAE